MQEETFLESEGSSLNNYYGVFTPNAKVIIRASRLHTKSETALIRVTNDLLLSSDRGCISLLVLLDLSAAFDTIDHNILLNRLEHFVGISGSALAWFKSYLSDRHQFIAVNEEVSYRSQVQYGVPQGSVLLSITITFHALHVTLGRYYQETWC